MSEQKVKIEMLYGFKAARPHWTVAFQESPAPTVWDVLRGLALEIVGPALLCALAFTALKFALLGHF